MGLIMGRRKFLGRESSLMELEQRGQGTAREGHFPLGHSEIVMAAHQAPVKFGMGALS